MKKNLLMMLVISALTLMGFQRAHAAEQNVTITTHDYVKRGTESFKLDIYLRDDLKDADSLPVMMYVHGGGFVGGSRINAAQEVFLRHYAEQGYLAVSIDYRLAGMTPDKPSKYGAKTTDESIKMSLEDMAAATAWVLKNCKVDPKRFFTAGGSAGAIMVLQIENDICNDVKYIKETLPAGFNYAGIVAAAGCMYTLGNANLSFKHQPCPMLLMNGSEDILVTDEVGPFLGIRMYASESLHKLFTEKQIPHWYYREVGADHVVAMTHLTDNLEETDKFIRRFVNEGKKACVYTEWKDVEPASMGDVEKMVRYAPLYILGYDKYLKDIDWNNLDKPKDVVY